MTVATSRAAVVAVALLAALAGCGAAPLDGGSGAPDVAEQSWSDGERVNVTDLFAAHHDWAANASSYQYEATASVREGGTRSVSIAVNRTTRRALRVTDPADGASGNRAAFFDRGTLHVRERDGETKRYTENTDFERFVDESARVGADPRIVAQWDFEYVGFQDGAFVFEADTVTADENVGGIDVASIVATNATLVVAPDGYVESFTLDATVETDGERVEHSLAVEYAAVGETTVETPAWVEEAS